MGEPRALVGNAADPKQVSRAAEREQSLRRRDVNDLLWVLSERSGRRFLWRYLCECGLFKTSFHASGSIVYFNEGRREIGLRLLADVMEADPRAYHEMAAEAKAEDDKREPTPKGRVDAHDDSDSGGSG